MSTAQLKEKLDALQCHFTWQLGVDSGSSLHILHKVAVEIQHTHHQNRVALLGLQAYLQQLRNHSTEALQSLNDAEEYHGREEQAGSAAGSVTIYGNYAWVYYLQGSYQEAERYLERIQQLCPTPWDARLIADIQAQKGWALLLIRVRNGERARACFEAALMLQPENRAFRTGLAMALYSSWNYFHHPDFASEAITHMQRIVHEQPKNYRAKIYLARLLEQKDKEKAIDLAKACTENSSDPEVLKSSVCFWLPQSLERAMEIIQRVLQEDPGYHLLYQTLATCYKQQWINADEADKSKIVDAAIKDLQRIVQTHPDLDLTPVKLQLAEFFGAKGLLEKEEEIYKELQKKIETLSLRCRQSLNAYWGKHLLYRRGCPEQARAKFMDGYRLCPQTDEGRHCERRLRTMAQGYKHRGNTKAANDIYQFLDETREQLAEELTALCLDANQEGDSSMRSQES